MFISLSLNFIEYRNKLNFFINVSKFQVQNINTDIPNKMGRKHDTNVEPAILSVNSEEEKESFCYKTQTSAKLLCVCRLETCNKNVQKK